MTQRLALQSGLQIRHALGDVTSLDQATKLLTEVNTTFGAIVVVGLSPGNGSVDALVAPLRARTHRLLTSWRQAYPTISLRWTACVPIPAHSHMERHTRRC